MNRSFRDDFVDLFDAHFQRLHRYLDRLSGEPELASDIAQETFMKLYQRGALPDDPGAWLVTVAMNLLRNARTTSARRGRLLERVPEARRFTERPVEPEPGVGTGDLERRVRAALERMPERERRMLLLRAEGYSYREIAAALRIGETSIGTLLARAKRTFRDLYHEAGSDAS